MPLILKISKLVFIGFLAISVLIVAVGTVFYLRVLEDLPDVESLRDVQLQTPLKVYSRDGLLMSVYGEKRRKPLIYQEIPPQMINAFLAAEDDRFFVHPGVDYQGILRAVVKLIMTGEKRQGGSTITMQLARNFFLTSERTYLRKIKEILLALRIEKELSKEEILTLYLNKIYLGSRAYGVGAAAEVFYGKDVSNLDLAQIAMIAGLPKAPSGNNPLVNPEGALQRRNYVLRRMLELNMIDSETYRITSTLPLTASRHDSPVEVNAPYISEMVRMEIVQRYGQEQAYEGGMTVFTTIDAKRQNAATESVQQGLLAYDRRHGYRGALSHIDVEKLKEPESVQKYLHDLNVVGPLVPGVVIAVNDTQAMVLSLQGEVPLDLKAIKWARKYINENSLGKAPSKVSDVLTTGDVIYISQDEPGHWELGQLPQVSGALVSMDPQDGALIALVGGFDFYHSKFNRAIQAHRQPGSSFKPFIYSAALEHGYTPATMVNDAPVVVQDRSTDDYWRPQNYSGQFFGPTRLRQALTKSRNMVSIRVLRDIGRDVAMEHVAKFGFDPDKLPKNLTLALGSGEVTPLQLATAYTVFANRGYKVEPYFIDRIVSSTGDEIYKAHPARACDVHCRELEAELSQHTESLLDSEALDVADDTGADGLAPRIVSETNIYQMDSMMKDVIRYGTGVKAKQLGRQDIAGKTGTTNEQKDAWFSGYQYSLVTTVWVGFDAYTPLGRQEVGGVAALPIWIDYMRVALKGVPESIMPVPEGMVTLKIDPDTGLLVDQNGSYGMAETFRVDHVPPMGYSAYNSPGYSAPDKSGAASGSTGQPMPPEQLF